VRKFFKKLRVTAQQEIEKNAPELEWRKQNRRLQQPRGMASKRHALLQAEFQAAGAAAAAIIIAFGHIPE
jgi:hypothetical protein